MEVILALDLSIVAWERVGEVGPAPESALSRSAWTPWSEARLRTLAGRNRVGVEPVVVVRTLP